MKVQKEKIVIVLTVLIDVIGLGIIIPTLPFYVEKFGASHFATALLFSAFALCSFMSGPLLGALSDKIGRRPVLIISIASTAVGWFVFASAHALWVLFLGRIIDGMAAGNFPIAQSYLVDIAKTSKERTHNLGIIGAVFGIGFIIGPALGAALSAISPSAPFWLAGILATINVVLALLFLPETNKQLHHGKKISLNPLLPVANALGDGPLRPRYIAWLLFGTAFSLMQSVLAMYAQDVFGYSATVTGYVFTGMGVILVFNQVVGLKRIWLNYFTERVLETYFFLVMAAGFMLAGLKNVTFFFLGVLLITLGQSTLRVVISSAAAGAAGSSRRGEVLGIMSSILSLSMILGPLMGGALFGKNPTWPFLFGSVLLIGAFSVVQNCCRNETIAQEEHVETIG